MTYSTSGTPSGGGDQGSTSQVAKDQAAGVGHTAADSARGLAGEARSEAGEVAREAGRQARDVLGQARGELVDQAGHQQHRLAEGLRSLGSELDQMAAGAQDGGGLGADLVRQVGSRAGAAATWLDDRDPGALVDELKGFARRRPGTFLVVAAGLGLLAGRLTRAVKDESSSSEASGSVRTPSRRPSGAEVVPGGGAHRAPGAPSVPEDMVTPPVAGQAPIARTPTGAGGQYGTGTAAGEPVTGLEPGRTP